MKKICLLALSGLAALWSAQALASEAIPPVAEAPTAPAEASDSAEPTPLTASDLGTISAGQSVKTDVLTNQQLTATNTGNTITAGSVTNGDITFSGNSLGNYNGIGNFVSNTGNNNNLQGSISVTIVTAPTLP